MSGLYSGGAGALCGEGQGGGRCGGRGARGGGGAEWNDCGNNNDEEPMRVWPRHRPWGGTWNPSQELPAPSTASVPPSHPKASNDKQLQCGWMHTNTPTPH